MVLVLPLMLLILLCLHRFLFEVESFRKERGWCRQAQKHQQGPITSFKWSNDLVQEKGIECIGFEGFDQVKFEGSIGVSRGGPNISFPCVRGAQSNLIWAMR
jgi:hypothetical protein